MNDFDELYKTIIREIKDTKVRDGANSQIAVSASNGIAGRICIELYKRKESSEILAQEMVNDGLDIQTANRLANMELEERVALKEFVCEQYVRQYW